MNLCYLVPLTYIHSLHKNTYAYKDNTDYISMYKEAPIFSFSPIRILMYSSQPTFMKIFLRLL